MQDGAEPRLLRWETQTKTKFDRLDKSRCVVLVTCSPLEVHGPHLPFGADALEGEGLAVRMLRFLPGPASVHEALPPRVPNSGCSGRGPSTAGETPERRRS